MRSDPSAGALCLPADSFLRTIGLGFACAVILMGVVGTAFYRSLATVENTAHWTSNSHETINALESLLSHMIDIETGQRGYALTGAEQFLDPYRSGRLLLERDRQDISERLRGDEEMQSQFTRLERALETKVQFVEQIIVLRRTSGLQAVAGALELLDRSRRAMEEVRAVVKTMQEAEERRLGQRVESAERSMREVVALALVGIVLMVFILIWVFVVIRQETRRRRSAQTALERAQGELEFRIRERTKQLAEMNGRLSSLSRQMLQAQEAERRRIARDLHDEIGQALTALKLNLKEADDSARQPVKSLIHDSLGILSRVIEGVRSLALDLRPSLLDELGLGPAAKWYVKRQGERAGWDTSFVLESWSEEPIGEAAITCFRILQEALTNAAKHAQATTVDVILRQDSGRIVLTVRDNGKGFDLNAVRETAKAGHSMGVLGMEERASLMGGALTISSTVDRGTEVTASVPIESPVLSAGPVGAAQT